MSRDHGEVERAFIAGLADDTGRDLAAWMALIDTRSFAHRNDMIDWLRQQGLTFAKASRLERIHHNGGKPLYGDRPAPRPAAEPSPVAPPPAPAPAPPIAVVAAPPPTPSVAASPPLPATAAPVPPPATDDGDLATFLAKAKGYRPLAELLIRNIRATIPATTLRLCDTHADLAAPAPYGAVAVTAKDVRLSLDLGDHPFEGDIKRLRLPGTAPAMTHTIILNDARRIDAALQALIVKAAARANR